MQASASALGALRKTTWLGLAAVTDNTRTKPKPEQHARQTQSAAAFHTRLFACTASRDCIVHTQSRHVCVVLSIRTVVPEAARRACTTRGAPTQKNTSSTKIGNILALAPIPSILSVQRIELLRISCRQSWDYDPTKSTCKCWSSPKVNTAWAGTNAGSYSTLREAREACESQLGCGGISHKQAKYYTWNSYKTRPGYFPGWTSWYYGVDSCASGLLS